jgi:hypothetical protein
VGHHGLAGVDALPDLQPEVGTGSVEIGHRRLDGQGSPHGTLRVVLVRDGRSEDPEGGVPDELVQGSAEGFDLPFQCCVEGSERGLDVLGVRLIGAGGEPDQVAEQHGDHLPFLSRRSQIR